MAEVMQGESSTVVNFTSSGPLSASWEILESPLDDVVLSNIWEKAVKIVTSPGAVQPAPFFPSKQTTENTFLVVSESGCENFHNVKCYGSINTVVECSCPGFKSLGICSHAVAISEKQGVLTKYLDAFNRSTSLNITSINVAGKQDPNIGRKKSNPRKRFKGPIPNVETVVSCKNVFGLTTPKQPQLSMQQDDMHNVHFAASKVCGVNNQTPGDSQNDALHGGALVQSEASVPLVQSECDASRGLQPGSNSFDSAFSFLADLLNDDPVSVSLAGTANPVHGNGGLQDCTLPSRISASPSLVMPVTADSTMTTSLGSKTATPIPNVHMAGSWGCTSITSPPNVPMMVPWGSNSSQPPLRQMYL